MNITLVKTQSAQPMGTYKPTAIDAQKQGADFRLIEVAERFNRIVWRDGHSERVSDWQLANLQSLHTWAADF